MPYKVLLALCLDLPSLTLSPNTLFLLSMLQSHWSL